MPSCQCRDCVWGVVDNNPGLVEVLSTANLHTTFSKVDSKALCSGSKNLPSRPGGEDEQFNQAVLLGIIKNLNILVY